jgi:hypothetical protein
MLNGKAIARAIRGHFLIDTALHCLLGSEVFGFPLPTSSSEYQDLGKQTSLDFENSQILIDASELYAQLLDGTTSAELIRNHSVFRQLQISFQEILDQKRENRTARLWIQYSEMIQILRTFIRAERTGDWNLHLQALHDMLPYFAAAGHNLYTKSCYVYLMIMKKLETDHPDVHQAFQNGHHVIRRSERYWAGLSTDLTIEQVLMRSVKTAGGLTRGRGIGESQRALWLLSMPSCAEVNQAMQEVTDAGFYTSEQHKEETKARQERDQKDVLSIIDVMKDRSPFAGDANLRNIETGVGADRSVNADNAKGVGDKIIKSMEGRNILDFSFKRKDQVVTMSSKTSIKIDGETVHVDPQLLFQRCTTAANGLFDDISEIFKYELCNFPSLLFDANGFPREAHKSTLADIMWENSK